MNLAKCLPVLALPMALMAASASAHGWSLSAVADHAGPTLHVVVGVSDADGREVTNLQARNFTAFYEMNSSAPQLALGLGSIVPPSFFSMGGGFYRFDVKTTNPQHSAASIRTLGLTIHQVSATDNVPPRPTLVERARIVIPVRPTSN